MLWWIVLFVRFLKVLCLMIDCIDEVVRVFDE